MGQVISIQEHATLKRMYETAVNGQKSAQKESQKVTKRLFLFQNQIRVVLNLLEQKKRQLGVQFNLAKNTNQPDKAANIQTQIQTINETVGLLSSKTSNI